MVQGITILTIVVVSLTDREKEHGLSHVVLSSVTKFTNLGIKYMEDLSKNRLCTKIYEHLKISKCLEEENRLCDLE